jgi:23S rRNA (cytidine2498-2'-O)-methyltransferase
VSEGERFLVTAQPEFLEAAFAELRAFDEQLVLLEEPKPGVALCASARARWLARRAAQQPPIFVRHLAPVQAEVPLDGSDQDIGRLARTLAALPEFALLEKGRPFAVQTRLAPAAPGARNEQGRAYSSGRVNEALAGAIAAQTGASESIRQPQVVVSLLLTATRGFVGISPVEENLSAWPGGERHFARTPEQISRAEFKLLEALEVFALRLPRGGLALDLGAAPGGWTRLLLAAGLQVVAVDPAELAPSLMRHAALDYQRCSAEHYLARSLNRDRRFAIITSDMRMDARDAARVLVQARRLLSRDGFVVSVLKLPHAGSYVAPLPTLQEALRLLRQAYRFVRARQLFHNRQEVTVVAACPQ